MRTFATYKTAYNGKPSTLSVELWSDGTFAFREERNYGYMMESLDYCLTSPKATIGAALACIADEIYTLYDERIGDALMLQVTNYLQVIGHGSPATIAEDYAEVIL